MFDFVVTAVFLAVVVVPTACPLVATVLDVSPATVVDDSADVVVSDAAVVAVVAVELLFFDPLPHAAATSAATATNATNRPRRDPLIRVPPLSVQLPLAM
jgi:hypothetical protein